MSDVVPMLALGIPILALLIPIVAILSAHQRRMAEIIHQNKGHDVSQDHLLAEMRALRGEISDLRERMNQQAIALDTLASRPTLSTGEDPSTLRNA